MGYNPDNWGIDWSCEDNLYAKKPGMYTIHKLSFAKILF